MPHVPRTYSQHTDEIRPSRLPSKKPSLLPLAMSWRRSLRLTAGPVWTVASLCARLYGLRSCHAIVPRISSGLAARWAVAWWSCATLCASLLHPAPLRDRAGRCPERRGRAGSPVCSVRGRCERTHETEYLTLSMTHAAMYHTVAILHCRSKTRTSAYTTTEHHD